MEVEEGGGRVEAARDVIPAARGGRGDVGAAHLDGVAGADEDGGGQGAVADGAGRCRVDFAIDGEACAIDRDVPVCEIQVAGEPGAVGLDEDGVGIGRDGTGGPVAGSGRQTVARLAEEDGGIV